MQKGFTLAEILITLGIIGIVSAMTIPALIVNYQKHVYYTQFMKSVSSIENAVKMFYISEGCDDGTACIDIYDGDDCPTPLIKGMAKHMNALSFYSGYDDNNYNKELDEYNIYSKDKKLYSTIDEDALNIYFITNTGLIVLQSGDFCASAEFMLDTNGKKAPNTIGKDIFFFAINDDNKITWAGNDNYPWEYECDDTGWGCAGKLLQEGRMNY